MITRYLNQEMAEEEEWYVDRALISSGARALLCPSRCQKLDKIFFRHLLRLRYFKSFRQRYKATNMSVSSTKWNFILAYESKLDKEFRELKQQNQNRYLGSGQRKRYGKLTLLICEVYMK